MWHKVKLTVRNDYDLGGLGLYLSQLDNVPDGMPALAHEGRVLAHDLIEHVNGTVAIGGPADELMALGALWYTRGQWGDLRRDNVGANYSAEESIGYEFYNILGSLAENANRWDIAPTRTTETLWEDALAEIYTHGIASAKNEIAARGDDEDSDLTKCLQELSRHALGFLRRGIRKQHKRYPDPCWANTLFWNVAEAADGVIRNMDYEGQRWTLSYNTVSGEVRTREVGESYY